MTDGRGWTAAVDDQLVAARLMRLAIDRTKGTDGDMGWNLDLQMLEAAAPFAWADDVARATLAASAGVPGDVRLDGWALPTEAAWWRFEKPILLGETRTRALAMGWVTVTDEKGKPARTSLRDRSNPRGMVGPMLCVAMWTDGREEPDNPPLFPASTLVWYEGHDLREAMRELAEAYEANYGKGGVYHNAPHFGAERYLATAEATIKFVIAGLAWLRQGVAVERHEPAQRQRRKEFEKRFGRPLSAVSVVQLRRAEPVEREPGHAECQCGHKKFEHHLDVEADNVARLSCGECECENFVEAKVDWSCRWLVGGHWRKQPCGPGMADRRLKWIAPFVKGPEDMPFRERGRKVYEVKR